MIRKRSGQEDWEKEQLKTNKQKTKTNKNRQKGAISRRKPYSKPETAQCIMFIIILFFVIMVEAIIE